MMQSLPNPPQHIAIVMDGNGRWAETRQWPRFYGHVRGANRIRAIVQTAQELGVQALTLYAFSTENWKRPENEKTVLWKLLKKFLAREERALHENNVSLRVIGETERLSPDVLAVLNPVLKKLSANTGLRLTFAVSYGSKQEILNAVKTFAYECKTGQRAPEEISESLFESYLWTHSLGPLSNVDLVIRTGGELRTSNFLLWQSAYAEYVFLEKHWPDFGSEDLKKAVAVFQSRARRFGGIENAASAPSGSFRVAIL